MTLPGPDGLRGRGRFSFLLHLLILQYLENPQAVPSSQGHQRLSRQAVPHPPKLAAQHGHPARVS